MMLGLTILGIIDTVVPRINPNYRPAIVGEILPDWWTWQVWVIAILIVALIATLETAYRKMKELTRRNIGIGLAFNETRPDYKRINKGEETYIVGLRAIGGKIEDPEVFVHSLFEHKPLPTIGIDIPRIRLAPTINYQTTTVNPGITPTYFVNVFKHKVGQKEIEFCFFNYASEPIQLGWGCGEYQLILRARGSNLNEEGIIRLLLKLDEHGKLEVSRIREE